MSFLILGVGNKIKRDDAVGPIVASEVHDSLEEKESVDLKEASAGGFPLLGKIEGYDKVFLIDSVVTKDGDPGQWYYISLDDLKSGKGSTVSHSIDLKTMKEIGEKIGENIPEIMIFAIEVKEPFEFGEDLTEELSQSLPHVISEIREAIEKEIRKSNKR